MAINLQDSTASYGFQKLQQQAVHIRITREMKEALERARTSGEATSIQLPGAGAGLVSSVLLARCLGYMVFMMQLLLLQVIKIGNHSYETHPPSAQERLHVFTQSQAGCTEIAQIHQRAVVKVAVNIMTGCLVNMPCLTVQHHFSIVVLPQRSSLVNGHNQPAVTQVHKSQLLQQPAHQIPHQIAQRVSSGELSWFVILRTECSLCAACKHMATRRISLAQLPFLCLICHCLFQVHVTLSVCRSSAEWQEEADHAAGRACQKTSPEEWYTGRGGSEASWAAEVHGTSTSATCPSCCCTSQQVLKSCILTWKMFLSLGCCATGLQMWCVDLHCTCISKGAAFVYS